MQKAKELKKISSYPSTGPDRPSRFQEVEVPRQSAHEGGKDVSPYESAAFSPQKIPPVLFLLEPGLSQ
jgi:hypothetical protein